MKRFFANLKLFKKLLMAPLVVILFLLILGLTSYTGLSNQKSAIEDIFQNRFKSYQTSAVILKDMANVHANLYKVISWANAQYDAKKIDLLGKEQLTFLDRTEETIGKVLQAKELMQEEKALYQIVLSQLKEYKNSSFSAIDLASSDLNMATMYMETAENKFQILNKSLHDLLNLESKLSQERYDFSVNSFNAALKTFIIVLVIAIGASILVSLLIARMITFPVRETTSVVKRIAAGDLTQEIKLISRDEIGDLAQSVNSMRHKMGEAVGQSVAMSHTLSEAASEQAASLEETSSSLEEMASMTKQNAGSATQAKSLIAETQQVIEKADDSMKELTGSMKKINEAGEQTQKIVKTIDEIAFQTNLLALNAAVEAARAGESGAGFAVVADEVRNLAMRAAEAARSTTGLMEDIVKKVKNGQNLVDLANEAFNHVTERSKKVVNLVGEIAAASQEQSQGIDQINKAVAEMNRVTQQNAASAEELASIMAMFRTNGNALKIMREA